MRHDEEIEQAKKYIRSFTDEKLLTTFRLLGISLAEMDRAELLGAICFLCKENRFIPPYEVKENKA